MILYHATHKRNLDSIYRHGISTRWACSPGMRVWACTKSRVPWAVLHAVRRHGGPVQDIVVIQVRVPRGWFTRSRYKGLWNTRKDVPGYRLVPHGTFEEISAR